MIGLPPLTVVSTDTVTVVAVRPKVAVTPDGTPGAVTTEAGGSIVVLWTASSVPADATTVHVPIDNAVTNPVVESIEQTVGVVVEY